MELLKTIPDPRGKRGKRHPLWLALFISLLGSLCSYWGYRPLAKFCKKHRKTVLNLLKLNPNHAILPSYSTFRRIFNSSTLKIGSTPSIFGPSVTPLNSLENSGPLMAKVFDVLLWEETLLTKTLPCWCRSTGRKQVLSRWNSCTTLKSTKLRLLNA